LAGNFERTVRPKARRLNTRQANNWPYPTRYIKITSSMQGNRTA
jgi:hypothetical protein